MDNIVGVRFVEAGPIAYCAPDGLNLGMGDYVVVRTDRGERLGWVVITPDQVISAAVDGPLRVVDRLASEEDVGAWRAQRERAQEDLGRAQAIATRTDPRVRVASLMYDLAGECGELTYVAHDQERGEWLRRDASRILEVDLEVQQVGDRDRAKALGGLGQCGRALCCSSWQVEFPAISIKMAKDQGLAPNPSKISGVCGRLLCCLSFEVEAYREIVGTLPKVGKRVSTPVGRAKVISINALTEVVRLRIDETGEVIEIPAAQLRSQYGTAVRPADLEDQVEAPIRERDRELRDNFLDVLTPIDMPAPRRSSNEPRRERGDRSERPPRPEGERRSSTSRRSRPARDGSGGGDARPDRPPRAGGAGQDGAPRGEGRPGIARRRSSGAAPVANADGNTERPSRPEQAPRVAGVGPDGETNADGTPRRARRRGRRGGRRRGGAGEGGGSSENVE